MSNKQESPLKGIIRNWIESDFSTKIVTIAMILLVFLGILAFCSSCTKAPQAKFVAPVGSITYTITSDYGKFDMNWLDENEIDQFSYNQNSGTTINFTPSSYPYTAEIYAVSDSEQNIFGIIYRPDITIKLYDHGLLIDSVTQNYQALLNYSVSN